MNVQVELTAVLAVVLPIVVVLTGTVFGLVTYIIRRVVRRIDIMAVQLQELETDRAEGRARSDSDRERNDDRWQVSKDSRRDLIEIVDVKFGAIADRNRVIEQGYTEIQRQHDEIREQHSGMQRDIEELRAGLREIRDRIDAED